MQQVPARCGGGESDSQAGCHASQHLYHAKAHSPVHPAFTSLHRTLEFGAPVPRFGVGPPGTQISIVVVQRKVHIGRRPRSPGEFSRLFGDRCEMPPEVTACVDGVSRIRLTLSLPDGLRGGRAWRHHESPPTARSAARRLGGRPGFLSVGRRLVDAQPRNAPRIASKRSASGITTTARGAPGWRTAATSSSSD
jgi:hypothetical protein